VLALLSWPLSCCCDEPECGDDREDPGELCFRSERLGVDPGLSTPLALRSGLFDDDDLPDVLVIGTDVSGVSGRLLQSDGLSGLDQPRTVPVTGCSAYPVAGDIDGDGRLDLVFASCTQSVLVFRATGSADFAAAVEIPVGVIVRQAVIADADGDGLRDLLVLGLNAGGVPTLSFAQALADGSFAPAFLTPQPTAAFPDLTPSLMVAGRLDRSGRFEVIFAESERSGALVRTHYTGAAAFAAPELVVTSLRPAGLVLRDLDGDDDLDLLTGERTRGQLVSFLSAGDELAEGPRTEDVGTAWQTFKLGQLDDDGTVDLAVITEDHVELFRGLGDGSFTSGADLGFPSLIAELALVDLNADGRDDLVAGTFTGDDPLTIVFSGP